MCDGFAWKERPAFWICARPFGWPPDALAHFPTRPESRVDVGVRFRAADGLHLFGVPLDLLARSQRDIPQEKRFRKRGGVGEVGKRLALAADGIHPLLVVA